MNAERRRSGTAWLCLWRRRPPLYAVAQTAEGAAGQLVGQGLPRPAAVIRAGFTAYPNLAPAPQKPGPKPSTPSAATRVRVEGAIHVYSALRAGWPLPSLLRRPDPQRATPFVLLQFVADVGAAIERLTTAPVLLRQVVLDQSAGCRYRAAELQARRLGEWHRADLLEERKILHFTRAHRLRRRKEYGEAAAELEGALAGGQAYQALAADSFRAVLLAAGLPEGEVDALVAKCRRISRPRL